MITGGLGSCQCSCEGNLDEYPFSATFTWPDGGGSSKVVVTNMVNCHEYEGMPLPSGIEIGTPPGPWRQSGIELNSFVDFDTHYVEAIKESLKAPQIPDTPYTRADGNPDEYARFGQVIFKNWPQLEASGYISNYIVAYGQSLVELVGRSFPTFFSGPLDNVQFFNGVHATSGTHPFGGVCSSSLVPLETRWPYFANYLLRQITGEPASDSSIVGPKFWVTQLVTPGTTLTISGVVRRKIPL